MIIKGYRYDVTGAFGYDFYDSSCNHVCGIGELVLPNSEVYFGGWNLSWKSKFDPRSTIVPGIRRYISDAESGEQVASILYRENGLYDIEYGKDRVHVQTRLNQYIYTREETTIALSRRSDKSQETIEKYPYVPAELRFTVTMQDDLKEEWMLLILAFPCLQFFL